MWAIIYRCVITVRGLFRQSRQWWKRDRQLNEKLGKQKSKRIKDLIWVGVWGVQKTRCAPLLLYTISLISNARSWKIFKQHNYWLSYESTSLRSSLRTQPPVICILYLLPRVLVYHSVVLLSDFTFYVDRSESISWKNLHRWVKHSRLRDFLCYSILWSKFWNF